jgi:hypothetical protein
MSKLLSDSSMDMQSERIDVSDVDELYVEYDGYVYVEE